MNENNSYLVGIPVALSDTLKSFGKKFLLFTSLHIHYSVAWRL